MDTVSEIKQKLDIVDVIGSYITLKKAGRNYKANCPFHSEDTPSFMVSPELQIYKCFGCGEAGDMFNFVEKVEGVDFPRALDILADKAGIEVIQQYTPEQKDKSILYEINQLTSRFYHFLLTKHNLGKAGMTYLLEKRKINSESISKFVLGYAPDSWDTLYKFLNKKGYSDEHLLKSGVIVKKSGSKGYIDKFRGRIVFPFIDINGKIIGFNGRDLVGREPKYLNTQETMIFDKGSFLYGLNFAKISAKKKGLVFVEGQIDVIKAHQKGLDNVVASSGTSLTKAHLQIIKRYTNEVTLCFDPDEAGENATQRALDICEPHDFEVKVVPINDKFKDLDDFIDQDFDSARNALKNPIPIYDFYYARALKLFSADTAYGKKKIVNYLSNFFSKINNQVVLDHYIKKISDELDIEELPLRESFRKGSFIESTKKTAVSYTAIDAKEYKKEDYLLALLLRAPLDTIGQHLYKLESDDFSKESNQQIFIILKDYINRNSEEFDIKLFLDSLEDKYRKLISDLFLWDFANLEQNQTLFEKELQATILRIKKDSTKRKLKKLEKQIKLAELEKDAKAIKSISEEINKLTKELY